MDEADLQDLFAPFGPVTVNRMFGGKGVWADGVMIALVAYGELYMKTDAANAPMFEGEAPFSFRRGEKTITTNLVKLPAACFDDADMLVRYAASSLEAARRSAAKKPPRRARRGVRKER
ncbi:TfoX/Sxy family protein [Acuticoccus sp. I52.16.1]|uniref:TfoX/Sxy family protein n=1 Tax=Acuticoccus sp. I52.16.1 TaxID=2928472 RepID=UPI001FD539B9|nr:TfoX/Sxy family protein [Acuticoccus sp. I52.16.1]UOM33807.1 TfoX/Sxy family protein [Acuticoccus sp. I52.16.1]